MNQSAHWMEAGEISGALDSEARSALAGIGPQVVPKGSILFRPGDHPRGFMLVLSGKVSVYLTGAGGREILLYDVKPGQTCIQTTLGMIGGSAYSGEAIAETDCSAVVIPPDLFARLMEDSAGFRSFVFRALGLRLAEVTHLLEQVAFVKTEKRLARALIERADAEGRVDLTHNELATIIGTAREVVSRRLEKFASSGLVDLDRGSVVIANRAGLVAMCRED